MMAILGFIFLLVIGLGLCWTGIASWIVFYGFTGKGGPVPVVAFLCGVGAVALAFYNSPFSLVVK